MGFPIHSVSVFSRCAASIAFAAFVLSQSAAPVHASGYVLYRINCGGPAYTSPAAVTTETSDPSLPAGLKYQWAADTFFTGGGVYSQNVPIVSSAADSLFITERWNPDPPDGAQYSIPVPNGAYNVGFYFAEISPDEAAVGLRVFNVIMNGAEAFHNLDIFATVGAKRAYAQEKPVTVTDGHIRISFVNVAHHAKISAITVARPAVSAGTKAPYRVNCGGNDYYDAQGNAWETDRHFIGGSANATLVKIAGTQNQPLYNDERVNDPAKAPLQYIFDLVPGDYTVRLHFAEPWDADKAVGKRIFNVTLNGTVILDHFDIFAAAGFAKEIIKEAPLTIAGTGGQGIIAFQNVAGAAKIDAIEVLPAVSAGVRAMDRKNVAEENAGKAFQVKARDALGRKSQLPRSNHSVLTASKGSVGL